MEKSFLRQVIIDHQDILNRREEGLIERDIDLEYYLKGNEVVIISGIRRCGKSTLLKIIAGKLVVQTNVRRRLLVDTADASPLTDDQAAREEAAKQEGKQNNKQDSKQEDRKNNKRAQR